MCFGSLAVKSPLRPSTNTAEITDYRPNTHNSLVRLLCTPENVFYILLSTSYITLRYWEGLAMKSKTLFLCAVVLACAAITLVSCSSVGRGNGPPPHAPAHGYRHKHRAKSVEIVYDSGRDSTRTSDQKQK